MSDKRSVAPSVVKVPPLIFSDLPDDPLERLTALCAIRDSFESAFLFHTEVIAGEQTLIAKSVRP